MNVGALLPGFSRFGGGIGETQWFLLVLHACRPHIHALHQPVLPGRGIVGGYLGPPGAVRGALGGFLGGLIVAAIFSVVAVVGGTAFLGPVGTLIGLGIAVLLFALALYFGILGAVGGAIGGALKTWMVSRRNVTG